MKTYCRVYCINVVSQMHDNLSCCVCFNKINFTAKQDLNFLIFLILLIVAYNLDVFCLFI